MANVSVTKLWMWMTAGQYHFSIRLEEKTFKINTEGIDSQMVN